MSQPLTINHLPADLLSHILCLTTLQPPGKLPPTLLTDFLLTEVSPTFRSAFLPTVTHIDLRFHRAHHLALQNFAALQSCIHLNAITVDSTSNLTDQNLLALFAHLRIANIHLRYLELLIAGPISLQTLLSFARFFSPSVTHLLLSQPNSETLDHYLCAQPTPPTSPDATHIAAERARIDQIVKKLERTDPDFAKCPLPPLHTSSKPPFETALRFLPNLFELRLFALDFITDETLLSLKHALPNLENLHMSQMPGIHDREMAIFVASLPQLRKLFLQCVGTVGDCTVEAICHSEIRHRFSVLVLEGLTNLGDNAIANVATACPRLVEIDVSTCTLVTSAAMRPFANHPALQYMSFRNLLFSVTDMELQQFGWKESAIRTICVSPCRHVTFRGIEQFAAIPRLRSVYLSNLPPPSRRFLYQLGNLALETISLQGDLRLSTVSVQLLLGRKGDRIIHLRLEDVSSVLGGKSLNHFVRLCPNLQLLILRGNFSVDEGVILAQRLPRTDVYVGLPDCM